MMTTSKVMDFFKDLLGETIYGIPKNQIRHNEFKEEFTENPNLEPYEVILSNVPYQQIPRGTLKVYGRYILDYCI